MNRMHRRLSASARRPNELFANTEWLSAARRHDRRLHPFTPRTRAELCSQLDAVVRPRPGARSQDDNPAPNGHNSADSLFASVNEGLPE